MFIAKTLICFVNYLKESERLRELEKKQREEEERRKKEEEELYKDVEKLAKVRENKSDEFNLSTEEKKMLQNFYCFEENILWVHNWLSALKIPVGEFHILTP